MKKNMIFVVMFIFFMNFPVAKATISQSDNIELLKQYNIINDELLQKEYVTRGDSVESLCRLIGVNTEMKETAENSLYYSSYYHDTSELFNHHQYGYLLIASGYFCKGDSRYACADRNVTLKELSAFCTRVLGDKSESLDESLKRALEIGIINESDMFYSEEKTRNITPNELCVVLNRMLTQKRYYYAEYENVSYIDTKLCNISIDEDQADTYANGFEIRKKVDVFLGKWYESDELVNQIIPHILNVKTDLRNTWITFVWSPETLKEATETTYINKGDKIFIYTKKHKIDLLGEVVSVTEKNIIYRDIESNEYKNISENIDNIILIMNNDVNE